MARHTESQGKRLLFITLITLTDGALAFGKGTGSARPGGGPPAREGHRSPTYILYPLLSQLPALLSYVCVLGSLPGGHWTGVVLSAGGGALAPLHHCTRPWRPQVLGVAGLGIATIAGPTVPAWLPGVLSEREGLRTPCPPVPALRLGRGLSPSSFSLLPSVSFSLVLCLSEIHSVYELRLTEPSGLVSRVSVTSVGVKTGPSGSIVPLGVLEGRVHGCC